MKLENDKLFELREYNNLTQKAVGEILGVRQQTYAEWEKGKKIIPLKHLLGSTSNTRLEVPYFMLFPLLPQQLWRWKITQVGLQLQH